MTVYVYRNGEVVQKQQRSEKRINSFLATPMVSRFEAFPSPVTGQSISSWRQRDRDMDAAGAVDRRDIPQRAIDKRKRIVERNARAGKAERE